MNGRIVFTSAKLYDGHGASQDGMTIVVEGGKIAATGRDLADIGPAKRIDLAGKTVMPGMTCGHWHGEFVNIGPPLFGPGGATFLGTEAPPAILALHAARALRIALMSGVTRVISAQCSHNLDSQMQMALRSGLIEGADIVACSRHVLTTGDYEDKAFQWWATPALPGPGARRIGGNVFADGVDAIKQAVREEILFGAEIVKTYVDAGHGLPVTARYRSVSSDELRAIVDTAHERDRRVRVHVVGKKAIMECIELGIDILDHCDFLDEECIAAMVEKGTWYVPSAMFAKLVSSAGRGERLDPTNINDKAYLNLMKMLPLANDAGVRIVPGDDYGAQGMEHGPGIYARELEIYVRDFGIPAEDVLRWATRNGAAMALHDNSGTIEPGKDADMIVVDGDPGADIGILTDPVKNLKLILQRGRVVRNALDIDPAMEPTSDITLFGAH